MPWWCKQSDVDSKVEVEVEVEVGGEGEMMNRQQR